jgi:hypothetical protein
VFERDETLQNPNSMFGWVIVISSSSFSFEREGGNDARICGWREASIFFSHAIGRVPTELTEPLGLGGLNYIRS